MNPSNVLNGIVGFLLAGAILLLPTLILPGDWDTFRLPKVLVLRTVAILLLAIHCIRLLWLGPSVRSFFSIRHDPVLLIPLLIFLGTGVSTIFSPNPSVSSWAVVEVTSAVVLYYSAVFYARENRRSSMVFVLFLVPGIINTAVLVIQGLEIWHPVFGTRSLENYEFAGTLRQAALLGNRDDVGMYLLIPLAVALGLFFAPEKRLRAISFVATPLLLAGNLMTTTLTTIGVSAFLVWMATALYLLRRGCSLKFRAITLLLIPLLGVLILQGSGIASDRIEGYRTAFETGDWEQAAGNRLGAYAAALHMTAQHPILGVGPGRYPVEYVSYSIEVRDRYPWLLSRWNKVWFDMTHNDYLEIAAEAGLPMLVAGVFWMVSAMRLFWRKTTDEKTGWISFTGLAASTSIALCASVLFPLQLAAVYGSSAILVGLCIGRLT